jgi:membrane protein implicated in regulation of membrane protease activity
MSIAVSAFVRPSPTARRLLLLWGLAHGAAALAIAAAPLPLRYGAAPWLAAVLACAGLALAWTAVRTPKTHRIDISGTGELRLTVQQDVRVPRRTRCSADGSADDFALPPSAPLALLPGSTLWPGLMLLRLGAAYGEVPAPVRVVPIWRDSVDAAAWRALAVALGAIGRLQAPQPAQQESMNSLQQAPSRVRRRSQRDHVQ